MKNTKLMVGMFFCIGAILTGCMSKKLELTKEFDSKNEITVLSREEGSGTRISFLNLLEIEEEVVQDPENTISSTEVMLLAVESDPYAIGYVSHSQLPSTVKALAIDGFGPSGENIVNGKYPLVREFSLLTHKENSEIVADFIDFITSSNHIIEKNGYTPTMKGSSYDPSNLEGSIKISGSSSVYPLMDTLIEEYKSINPNVVIEINETDSANGIKNLSEGIVDIAMSSRPLSGEEMEQTQQFVIAKDTIAVIVNKENPLEHLSRIQLEEIYRGEVVDWNEVKE